jgi:hypothetical protein
MMKATTSWILLVLGSLVLLATVFFICSLIVSNIRSGWPPFRMPDFMGYSVGAWTFLTDARAMLLAQIGVALLVIAVGLHFRHLHQQEIGRQQMLEQGIEKAESDNGGDSASPHASDER